MYNKRYSKCVYSCSLKYLKQIKCICIGRQFATIYSCICYNLHLYSQACRAAPALTNRNKQIPIEEDFLLWNTVNSYSSDLFKMKINMNPKAIFGILFSTTLILSVSATAQKARWEVADHHSSGWDCGMSSVSSL